MRWIGRVGLHRTRAPHRGPRISKPPPSATRPPLQRLHGRHLTRVPTSTQAGVARVAESLIGRENPLIRTAKLSQFDHKIRRLRYAPGRRGMPVTPVTMQRYSARSPGGTALALAARHDADRGGADRAGGTRWMAHAVRSEESPEDTQLPGRGGRVRPAAPVSRVGCDSRSARGRAERESQPTRETGSAC